MRYIELKIHASRQGLEMVTRLLLDYGINQVSIDDPADFDEVINKEHEYNWDYIEDKLKINLDREPTLSAWFEETEENKTLIQKIKIDIMKLKAEEQYMTYGRDVDFGRLYAETEYSDDSEWKDKWKENFKPLKVTDRIVVKPTWEQYEANPGEMILEIDPGMAFGTGTHETTRLCMRLLEKYIAEIPNADVLDIGCGSGILSISAALLGASDVLGIEIDPDAVQIAGENIQLNYMEKTVTVKQGDLTKGVSYKADIVVANLMHNLVMELSSDVCNHLNKNGIFISSGILIEKEQQVADAVRNAGFEIIEILEDGEWCAIAAAKKCKS